MIVWFIWKSLINSLKVFLRGCLINIFLWGSPSLQHTSLFPISGYLKNGVNICLGIVYKWDRAHWDTQLGGNRTHNFCRAKQGQHGPRRTEAQAWLCSLAATACCATLTSVQSSVPLRCSAQPECSLRLLSHLSHIPRCFLWHGCLKSLLLLQLTPINKNI